MNLSLTYQKNITLNDNVIKINSSIHEINNNMHFIKINDDNTVIFENLPNSNNLPLDVNYLNYVNEVISTTVCIPSYKINYNFNYNLKSIILKLETPILQNKIINNSIFKLNSLPIF